MNLKIITVALIALIAVVTFSGCTEERACQSDAMVCPDGTTVARNPNNNCEFNPCPSGVNSNDIPMPNLNEVDTEGEPPELPL